MNSETKLELMIVEEDPQKKLKEQYALVNQKLDLINMKLYTQLFKKVENA